MVLREKTGVHEVCDSPFRKFPSNAVRVAVSNEAAIESSTSFGKNTISRT